MKKVLWLSLVFVLVFQVVVLARINDRNIEWRRERVYIPVCDMAGFVAQNGVDDGAPVIAEVSSFGFTGLTIAATGDSVSHLMPVPRDMDVDQKVYFRVHYTIATSETLTATHESVTWAVVYDRTAENATLEAASTALTSAIAADIYLGTSGYHSAITPWGYVNAETFSEGELLALNIELDASDKFDLVHDNPILLGLEIEYSRRKCVGTPIDIENTR